MLSKIHLLFQSVASKIKRISSVQLPQCECCNRIPFFPYVCVLYVCVCAFGHLYPLRAAPSSADRTTGQSEGIWYGTVELADNLIYPFLPAGVAVSPSPNGGIKLPQSHLRHLDEPLWDLVDVAFIVVHVQYAVKLSVTAHSQLALSAQTRCTFPGESLADCLPCKALHLDVEELSEVAEPFNHLGGHTAVKLDIREVSLEGIGAGISCVEEHELGFLQVAGRQALLGVNSASRQVKLSSVQPSTSSHPPVSPHPPLPLSASMSVASKGGVQVAEQGEWWEGGVRWGVRRELQEGVGAEIVLAGRGEVGELRVVQ